MVTSRGAEVCIYVTQVERWREGGRRERREGRREEGRGRKERKEVGREGGEGGREERREVKEGWRKEGETEEGNEKWRHCLVG